MEFNLRAISLAESVAVNARTGVAEMMGREIEFRAGIRYSVTLPSSREDFGTLNEPERTLTALSQWARVFRYPDAAGDVIHVLAPADDDDGNLIFYRVDLRQPRQSRRGLRPDAEFIGSYILSDLECAAWLIELASAWDANPNEAQRRSILARPPIHPLRPIRLAWVGPELVAGLAPASRLTAIGKVYGADIVHVAPRGHRNVVAQIRLALPLHLAIVCSHFAPYITLDSIPAEVPRNYVHFCDSREWDGLEGQITTWLELCSDEILNNRAVEAEDEHRVMLALMLRAMLSHAKIGPFKHCQKQTVLKCIRSRRMNVPVAEQILDKNAEAFQDTRVSDAFFLWKPHDDGTRYFLNPRRVDEIRVLALEQVR
jgi:hypothetical protein